MEVAKCLQCDKELTKTEGKRQKHYCNKKCKAAYWNKKTSAKYKPKYKMVPVEDFTKMEMELAKLKIENPSPLVNRVDINDLDEYKPQQVNISETTAAKPKKKEEGVDGAENAPDGVIPPMPVREDYEKGFNGSVDFAAAKNIWKIKYGHL